MPLAASTEFEPVGKFHSKARDGHVGQRFERRGDDPLRHVGVADEVCRDPVALEDRVDVGERLAAVGDEVDGSESVPGSAGVVAVALPTREPDGQAAGLASKVAATHASLNVAWRAGSCLGSEVTTFSHVVPDPPPG